MAANSEFSTPRTFQPPKAGELINHKGHNYFLGRYIGQGYFGASYECRDEWGNQLVAKVLLPRNKSYEEIREQWLKELETLVNLRHPNITYIYDAFEFRDTFYLIIEQCSSTLADLFHIQDYKGDIWFPYVAKDLLQAINFIHNMGYVHKDIHPGNVFLSLIRDKMVPTKDPVLIFKIGDLGITRLESDINVFNTMLAKWMLPPEFLNPDKFGTVDRHVDIYHAGLLLLSVLLGYVPEFSQEAITQGEPRKRAEGTVSRFGPVVAKALRRHVDARTSTALEFWRDIVQLVP